MGEIGLPRREFLYDIRFWEARRIIRGYRRRNALQYQLQRIQAWASMFCMGNPKNVQPDELFPLYCDHFDEYNQPAAPPITKSEEEDMLALIDNENKKLVKKRDT